jgi:hypothetical protein
VLKELSRPSLAILNEDFPKVKTVNVAEIESLVNFMVTILNIKASTDDEIESLDIQMALVIDLVRTKFGYLTIPEIKEAFKMYISKEFPEIKVFRILDCVSIGDVLSAYTEYRNQSLRIYTDKKQALLNAPTQPSDEEKLKIRESFLKVIFKDITENGFSNDAWQLFFDLEKSGKINITTEAKKELYDQELKKYIPAHEEELKGRGAYAAKSLLKDFHLKIESGKNLIAVQNKCRSILVSNYLKEHLSDFETFKKEIEDEK